MRTLFKTLILAVCMLLALPFSYVHASGREPVHVLLVYDSLAKESPREGNVETLQRLLASFGAKVALTTFDSYSQGTMRQFAKVIEVRNAADLAVANEAYAHDLEAYEGGLLHIGADAPSKLQQELGLQTKTTGRDKVRLAAGQFSQSSIAVHNMPYIVRSSGTPYGTVTSESGDWSAPFAVSADRLAYAPYFEQGNLSELALASLLRDWLGVSGESHTYLVFKAISPFSNLDLLVKLADKLYDAGIPFIVSASPVLANTDYPAMQRYLETLKYVQSRNGSILVNAPVVAQAINQDDPELKAKMAAFVDRLAEYGVAPLGMGAELYWSYDRQYAAAGTGFFDSAVLFPSVRPLYKAQTNESQPFASSMYSVGPGFLQQFDRKGKAVQSLPMDTAVTMDFFENEAQLDEAVRTLSGSWITFADYKDGAHAVHTDAHSIASRGGVLLLDGKSLDLNSTLQEISPKYVYTEAQKQSLTTLFNVQNNVFMVIILATLLIFGFFFTIGSRLYKRKFFK